MTPQGRAGLLIHLVLTISLGLIALSLYQERAEVNRARVAALAELEGKKQLAEQTSRDLAAARSGLQKLEVEASQRQSIAGELRERLEALQKELASRDQASQMAWQQTQAKVAELTAALGEAKSQASSQTSALVSKIEEALKAKEQAAQLATQVAALEARAKEDEARFKVIESRAKDLEAKLKEVEGKLREKETLAATLGTEKERLQSELSKQSQEIVQLKLEMEKRDAQKRSSEPAAQAPPGPNPPVVTSVEDFDQQKGVLILGAGSKSGLEIGHIIWITRDGKPIARARIMKTLEDLSGAEIIELNEGARVQPHDRASTKMAGAGTPPEKKTTNEVDLRHEAPAGGAPAAKGAPPPPPDLPPVDTKKG